MPLGTGSAVTRTALGRNGLSSEFSGAAAAARPRHLVFVEASPGFGGSLTVLANLLGHLDQKRYVPHVVVGLETQAGHLRDRLPGLDVLVAPMAMHDRRSGLGRVLDRSLGRLGPLGRRATTAVLLASNRFGPVAKAAGRIAEHLRGVPVTAVWLNNLIDADRGIGMLLADRWDVPVVCKTRGWEYVSPRQRRLARRVALFLPDSRAVGTRLAELGVPADRIVPTGCSVDPERFDPADHPRTGEFTGGGRLAFGIVGMLLRWKGQHVFLDAAARVLAEFPQAVAVVVGHSPGGETDYADDLRRQAAELGIADRVVFTGHRPDVPQVMAELDVVVHASVEPEPFGAVIIEAMASERPVVAARVGGPPETIRDGVTGLLADPGDPVQLADRIAMLLRDEPLRRRLGVAGRKLALDRYTAAAHALRTMDLLDSVLPAGAGPPPTPAATEATSDPPKPLTAAWPAVSR